MSEPILAFTKAIVLGLSVAAPVGPISLLCLRRTLDAGFLAGFAGGIGTAAADACYALVAALGLTTVSAILIGGQLPMRLAGGLALLWLGWRTLVSRPAGSAATAGGGLIATFAGTFVLTIANPATILSFAAMFAGLGLAASDADPAAGALLVAGVFSGSLLWWLLLTGGVSVLRSRLADGALLWINRLSGALLIAFALWMLAILLP
jgi:putative LysE/RhtB family amino acid efflux pump